MTRRSWQHKRVCFPVGEPPRQSKIRTKWLFLAYDLVTTSTCSRRALWSLPKSRNMISVHNISHSRTCWASQQLIPQKGHLSDTPSRSLPAVGRELVALQSQASEIRGLHLRNQGITSSRHFLTGIESSRMGIVMQRRLSRKCIQQKG